MRPGRCEMVPREDERAADAADTRIEARRTRSPSGRGWLDQSVPEDFSSRSPRDDGSTPAPATSSRCDRPGRGFVNDE